MAWVLNTTCVEKPFYQIGMLSGDRLSREDLSGRAEVARVFKNGGRMLLANEQPTRLDLTDTRNLTRVPPLFSSMSGILVVNSVCHSALTALAPASLQTWPMTLSHLDEPLDPTPWYAINVHRLVDSIDLENSAVKNTKGFDGVVRPSLRLHKKNVAIRQGFDEHINLWRDETFPHILLISDELKAELASLGALSALEYFETS